MSDCCTPGLGFPNAANMQQFATNHAVVWEEICMLQQAILAASSQCQPGGGQMCTTVGGNTPMTLVTGVSSITVTNPGDGYVVDTPSIRFTRPRGSVGTDAIATVLTNGGNIISATILSGGSGYAPIPSTLTISSVSGIDAVLHPIVNAAGQIVSVNIVSAGSGYTTADIVSATRAIAPSALYTDATFNIAAVGPLGEIISVSVTNQGSGYEDSVATVEIVSALDSVTVYPLGTGFVGTVSTNALGEVTGVVVINSGAGYSAYSPYLEITDPGSGATTQVNLIGSTVGSVSVLTAGSNYTTSATGVIINPPTAIPPSVQATVTVSTNVNTYGTTPQVYLQAWSGTTTNKQITTQLNSVLTYFKGLGYTISIQTNPATGDTIQWKICW